MASERIAKFDNGNLTCSQTRSGIGSKKATPRTLLSIGWTGTRQRGIEKHTEDLKAMFAYAPDTRIKEHQVKIGTGEWPSVIGVMEGTFTKPMHTGDGKSILPTGKAFKLVMCTVGHRKYGLMDEEYPFWENQTFMKQIGLAA